MFGNLLSSVVKIATLPLDIADAGIDIALGGSGSKKSREETGSPLNILTELRDDVCDTIEDSDE